MILYEIIICNYQDDSNRSELVLSFVHLSKDHYALKAMLDIDPDYEYVSAVKLPKIHNFAFDEAEFDEIEAVIKVLKGKG
jgi:hypothetical protein